MSDGPITKALVEALELRKKLIADGTPEGEADYIVGQGLKGILGNKRESPWRFYCEHCRDTSWINVEPSELEQQRIEKLYGYRENATAGYVVKCEPCRFNEIQREKRRKAAQEEYDEDFAAAGQTKKRGFNKFGK